MRRKIYIAGNIKFLRCKNNLTQKQLCKALGFNRVKLIVEWESGLYTPEVLNVIKLSKFFKVPIQKFILTPLYKPSDLKKFAIYRVRPGRPKNKKA